MKSNHNLTRMILTWVLVFGFFSLLTSCATTPKPPVIVGSQLPICKVLTSVELPDSYIQGVAVVKDQLWVLSSKQKSLLMIDMKTNKILKSIQTKVGNPRGLTWDGENLWCADNETKMVHQIDISNGKIMNSIQVPLEQKQSSVLETLDWDGNNLWIAYAAGWSSRILKMDSKTGEVIQSMFANGYPRAMATDGKLLWVVSYNQGKYTGVLSQRTVTDDTKKMNLSRSFLCRTPGKEPADITYDGQYLWIADNELQAVQKIEIPSNR